MKKILFWTVLALLPGKMQAEDFATLLQQIEQHNPTLRAVRDGVEAEKLENHTGLTLADPEVEFSHFWGRPAGVGVRNDVSVSQTLDYATLSGMKRRMARSRDELAEVGYEERRLQVLLEASQLMVEVVYLNRCIAEHQKQQEEMQHALKLSEKAYAEGRITRLELNTPRLALAEVHASLCEEEMLREQALLRLRYLNGGQEVTLQDTAYSVPKSLGRGFLAVSRQREEAEQRVAEQEVRMARSAAVPQLTAGYASEMTQEEKFHGFTLGMNVPLWSNRRNVKRAKAQLAAARSEQQDALLRLKYEYEAKKARTERLRAYAASLAGQLTSLSSKEILHAAFQRGDVSALDYYVEIKSDYELRQKFFEAERDWQLAEVELAFSS